jgi:rRNA biogenesis protein RRP5
MTKHYREGTVHQARVTAVNPLDNIYSISLQPSVLAQAFLSHADLKAGMTVRECKIMRLSPKGMVVSVTDTITGFVPNIHLSDVMLRDPSKMFKIGATIKCQVLSCDPEQRKLMLTHKKSMMGSKIPILDSYDNVTPGDIYVGVVNGFIKDAAFISFYNNVKGFVHVSEMRYVKTFNM